VAEWEGQVGGIMPLLFRTYGIIPRIIFI